MRGYGDSDKPAGVSNYTFPLLAEGIEIIYACIHLHFYLRNITLLYLELPCDCVRHEEVRRLGQAGRSEQLYDSPIGGGHRYHKRMHFYLEDINLRLFRTTT